MSEPQTTGWDHGETHGYVDRVANIRLVGAPKLIILDAGSVWDGQDEVTTSIVRKLGVLSNQERLRIVVHRAPMAERGTLECRIPHELLVFSDSLGPPNLYDLLFELNVPSQLCIAVLSDAGAAVPDGCIAFYCGPGGGPAHTRATRMRGARATNQILALYGSALVQERAGLAFRGASAGAPIPDAGAYDRHITSGIGRAVEQGTPATPVSRAMLPEESRLRALAQAAFDRLIPNLLSNGAVVGAQARGRAPGEPNYWFHWQRDGAIAMRHVITWSKNQTLGLDTRPLDTSIARYVGFIIETQHHGRLGTSRYTVDGEPILGYGNPQLDGPALGALALSAIPDPASIWTPLKRYLDFLLTPTAHGPTMDIWEFVFGRLFNAEYLKRQALLRGAQVASTLGHSVEAAHYAAEAKRLSEVLSIFMDAHNGHLLASRDTHNPWFQVISGLDIGVIGAYLQVREGTAFKWDPMPGRRLGHDLDCLAHPAVLSTMMALEEAFESLYRVNQAWRAGGNDGAGLGRFPEDANDGLGSSGGNPWPLATLWGAQYYYYLAMEVMATVEGADGPVALHDPWQARFFQRLVDGVLEPGEPIDSATWLGPISSRLIDRGDAYLNFVVHHTPSDGVVSEQLDRDTGMPRGATDLSWALSELIATIALRGQVRAAR